MADLEEIPTVAEQAPATPPAPVAEAAADEFDKDRAMATIKNLREFEKTAKTQLKELESLKAEKQQRTQAEMTDLDRARKELADLQAQHSAAQAALQEARVKDAARNAVQSLNVAFQPGALDDAVRLGLFADLEFSDSGIPKGMNAAIQQLQEDKPYLFVSPTPPAGGIGATEKGKADKQDALSSLSQRWGIRTG